MLKRLFLALSPCGLISRLKQFVFTYFLFYFKIGTISCLLTYFILHVGEQKQATIPTINGLWILAHQG